MTSILVKRSPSCAEGRPRTPSRQLAEELKQYVKSRLAMYKYPRWVEFVNELPKTATGKIQRFKLREMAAEAPGSGKAA